MESLSDKNVLWQRDEILLILFASGRFHSLYDLLLLSEIFERLFPNSRLIGFKGNEEFISRQIELLKRKGCVLTIGYNIGISATGREYTINIINEKILTQELEKYWRIYRKMISRLPRVRGMWDNYLEDFLRRLNPSK